MTDSFLKAYRYTEKYEGGYAFDKLDKGGETYKGIARKYWKSWQGWKILDDDSLLLQDKAKELEPMVQRFYYDNFWTPIRGEMISKIDEALAIYIYDTAVNSGVDRASKMLQKALILVGAYVGVDGIIGKDTLRVLRNVDTTQLLKNLKTDRENFYENIVKRDPSQTRFLNGWRRRARGL